MTYKPADIKTNSVYLTFNFICRIYFLIDFFFDIVIMCIEKKPQIISIFIDIISIFPFLVMRAIVGMKFDWINIADMICSSLVCFRVVRISKFSRQFKSDVNREWFNIVCSILSLLIISTILINVFENTQSIGKYWLFLQRDCWDGFNCDGANDSFHNTFFFVMTTLATIGYGSSITSVIGRCFIIGLIIIQVVEIPSMTGNLMTQWTSKSIYARVSYKQWDNVDFILISGNISMGSWIVLLQEYFHPDHGENEKHALVLLPQQPDGNMKMLLQKYQNKLFFFEGECLKFNDWERCKFHLAKMIMLLCNKQTDDSSAEDSKTIIRAMAIKKHFARWGENEKKAKKESVFSKNEQAENEETWGNRLLIQWMRPESEQHFELSISKNSNKDQILCIDKLKLSLLAKTCLCKGIISWISNLITTNNVVDGGKTVDKLLEDNAWTSDYTDGKDYEIYKISLDSKRGYSFSELAHRIYKVNNGNILFGLNIESKKTTNNIVLLAPTDFILPTEDNTITIYGYLLAKDQSEANVVMINMQNDKYAPSKKNEMIISKVSGILLNNLNKKKDKYGYDDDDIDDIDLENKEKSITDKLILAQAYHVVSEPISKESAICQNLQGKLIVKSGHIIICGICQNLIDFIKPLRAKHIPKADCPTIVILSKELPDNKVWNSMAYFDEIFIVQGDPLNKKDLIRAGIANASKVVILAPDINEISTFTKNSEKIENDSARKWTREEEDLLDAKTIFKYNWISKIRNGIFCVIEWVNPTNVSFLNNKSRMNNDEYLFIKAGMDISFTSSFACGEVYYSNMMDNWLSQTYYNPNWLNVLKKLIIGESVKHKKNELKQYLKVESGNLYLIDMPTLEFWNIYEKRDWTFSLIFNKMLKKKKMIVLGVYKAYAEESKDNNKNSNDEGNGDKASYFNKHLISSSSFKYSWHNSRLKDKDEENPYGNNNNYFYYVVTSPPPDFKLSSKDKLFVISITYPNSAPMASGIEEGKNKNTEEFTNTKNLNNEKVKKREFREIHKEIDIEGEKKLKTLNKTILEMNNVLRNVKTSISNLNSESKVKIGESIKTTINQIYRENKLSANV